MPSITIGRDGPRVGLRNNDTHMAVAMPWEPALTVGTAMQRIARGVWPPEPQSFGPLTVRRDADDLVVSDRGGRLLFVMPCPAAIEVAHALIAKAHEAESEEADIAEAIAFDHALLQRLGVNLGLTSNPALQQWAGNEAAWNTVLRKAIPSSGALRQYHVGTPRVRRNRSPSTDHRPPTADHRPLIRANGVSHG